MSRRRWFRVHRAVGLAVAAIVLLSALTGAVLLFRGEITPAKPRARAVANPVPLETILERAVAAGDGSPATDVGLPLDEGDPYTVWLDDDAETEVYLDGRGRVLGTRAGREGLTRTLFRLHTGEVLGPLGTVLMLGTALGLCGLVYSGITMLWARRRARRKPGARARG